MTQRFEFGTLLYKYRPSTYSHAYQRGDHPKYRAAHAVECAYPLTQGRRAGDSDRRLAGQLRVGRGYSAQERGDHSADLAHACYYAGEVACEAGGRCQRFCKGSRKAGDGKGKWDCLFISVIDVRVRDESILVNGARPMTQIRRIVHPKSMHQSRGRLPVHPTRVNTPGNGL
jgi:hypothetical protein